MENIGLQDSLLSRFDLLFIVLDQMDPEQDKEISDHVLRMHRYRNPNEQDGDGESHPSSAKSPLLGRVAALGDYQKLLHRVKSYSLYIPLSSHAPGQCRRDAGYG